MSVETAQCKRDSFAAISKSSESRLAPLQDYQLGCEVRSGRSMETSLKGLGYACACMKYQTDTNMHMQTMHPTHAQERSASCLHVNTQTLWLHAEHERSKMHEIRAKLGVPAQELKKAKCLQGTPGCVENTTTGYPNCYTACSIAGNGSSMFPDTDLAVCHQK